MDVTFTNVLEGARQYFQGLPTATSSTAGPVYPLSASLDTHHCNELEQKSELPPTSGDGYWSSQPEPLHPPTREQTPSQQSSSHNSDTSGHTVHTQIDQSLQYQQYQEPQIQLQHQSYQFSRPHSREASSNQYHQSYQQQQQQQQQQSRSGLRLESSTASPSSSQSYLQLQNSVDTSKGYYHHQQQQHHHHQQQQQQHHHHHHHQQQQQPQPQHHHQQHQQHSYYPVQSQQKPQLLTNNPYKMATTKSINQEGNQYYKHNYTSSSQMVSMHYGKSTENKQYDDNIQGSQSQGFRSTHNLPAIAAIPSSNNYHTNLVSRENEQQHMQQHSTKLTPSSSSQLSSTGTHSKTSGNNSLSTNAHLRAYCNDKNSVQYDFKNNYTNQNEHNASQSYQYLTTTVAPVTTSVTQAYSSVTMTSSNSTNYNSSPIQSSLAYSYSNKMNQHEAQNVGSIQQERTVNDNRLGHVVKQKRESPLDLSVKTVRTPADSTLDDATALVMEHERVKCYANVAAVRNSGSVSNHNYPTYDVYANSFQRNLNSKLQSNSSASAPKVEFHPNFNVPAFNHHNYRTPTTTTTTTGGGGVGVTDVRKNSVQCLSNKPLNNDQRSSIFQNQTTGRYPTVSMPSVAHVNSYIQSSSCLSSSSSSSAAASSSSSSSQAMAKRTMDNLPRIDFPTPGHGHKTSALYPAAAIPANHHEALQKKRPADIAPSIVPNKITKVDSWRQNIDEQIEQRFSSYKQQQKINATKSVVVNGNCYPTSSIINQEKPKDMYNLYHQKQHQYHQLNHTSISSSYTMSPNQYTNNQQTHNQTYVPSAVAHHYPGYGNYSSQQQANYNHQNRLTNQLQQTSGMNKNSYGASGGGADKRVLSLLRNSLEIKGAKEAQKKLEQQEKLTKTYENMRLDIQHPSTDVTAPLQPKPTFINRHNVSPFTPTNFPEGHNSTNNLMYKLHIPKAINSVNFESDSTMTTTNNMKNDNDDGQIMMTANHLNHNAADYDGLAAFLAARIRTKAELKQVGPSQQNICNNNSHLHGIIEHQLNSPMKQQEYLLLNGSHNNTSPPKLVKEQRQYPPRRRLFSRCEDDGYTVVPHRDKSGLRSSSETSVFDFPDTDSEGEMPVLEKQTLGDMRRDRKSSSRQISNCSDVKSSESACPISPSDDLFMQACDSFMKQLKCGSGKKRGRRKKTVEADVLAKLETVTKEKPIDILKANTMTTTIAPPTVTNPTTNIPRITTTIAPPTIKMKKDDEQRQKSKVVLIKKEEDDDSDVPLINCKRKIEEEKSSESLYKISKNDDNDKMVDGNYEKKLFDNTSMDDIPPSTIIIKTSTDVIKKESGICSPVINKDLRSIIRPAKKPNFGDGSHFCPGWEEEVYKYKKSLRMPPSLIQVTRPPSYHRLSTSLPDLDPCPHSPTPSTIIIDTHEYYSSKKSKTKFDAVDSDDDNDDIIDDDDDDDLESNCSYNLFMNKKGYDSEGSSSIKSLPNTTIISSTNTTITITDSTNSSPTIKDSSSFLDKLLERYGGRGGVRNGSNKKRKHKFKQENHPKVIPKSEKIVELLPTPGLELINNNREKKITECDSTSLGFRQKTIDSFKEIFLDSTNDLQRKGLKISKVVLNSRTRKQARVLKQRATIKEVFGEDRPASAPPVTCVDHHTNIVKLENVALAKKEKPVYHDNDDNTTLDKMIKKENADKMEEDDHKDSSLEQLTTSVTKQALKNKLLKRNKNDNLLLKSSPLDDNNKKQRRTKKKLKVSLLDEDNKNCADDDDNNDGNNEDNDKFNYDDEDEDDDIDNEEEEEPPDDIMDFMKQHDSKSETPSIDGDELAVLVHKRKNKFSKIRRKFSSGFDYIRKKKKQIVRRVGDHENEPSYNNRTIKPRKRGQFTKSNPESVQDIQKEIKTWVLNKGIGETHLHRSARLGYTDIAAYCLEKMGCSPSPKDNAGYTPLHEASARGHLDIAKLLLLYGANVSESARGGIRPLHEAVENGYVEVVRLLLSYGADPLLATYSGMTPLALASDDSTIKLLQSHINDIQGQPSSPFTFMGPASCFDLKDSGYDIFEDAPEIDLLSNEDDVDFEVSDILLPNLYVLHGEPSNDRWILLQDLSNMLKIKSRDALLRQISPSVAAATFDPVTMMTMTATTITANNTTTIASYKTVLRELKMSEFLEQAYCCQFLNTGEKINTRASKIALVKYTDKVKELLNVEKVLISSR